MMYLTILTLVFMLTTCGEEPQWATDAPDSGQPDEQETEDTMSIGFLPKAYYNYATEKVEVADEWDRMPELWLRNGDHKLNEVNRARDDDDYVLVYFAHSGDLCSGNGLSWLIIVMAHLSWTYDLKVSIAAVVDTYEYAAELAASARYLSNIGVSPNGSAMEYVETDKHPNEVRGYPQLFVIKPDTNEIIGTVAGAPLDEEGAASAYVDTIMGRIKVANSAKF